MDYYSYFLEETIEISVPKLHGHPKIVVKLQSPPSNDLQCSCVLRCMYVSNGL